MSSIKINVVKHGEQAPEALPDDQWFFDACEDRSFVIEQALIIQYDDGRYPQIQFTCRDSRTNKCISVGSTMRLLNGVVTMAKGVATKQGLKDF